MSLGAGRAGFRVTVRVVDGRARDRDADRGRVARGTSARRTHLSASSNRGRGLGTSRMDSEMRANVERTGRREPHRDDAPPSDRPDEGSRAPRERDEHAADADSAADIFATVRLRLARARVWRAPRPPPTPSSATEAQHFRRPS